jgi:hypothetical protein
MSSYRATARFDGRFWTASVRNGDGDLAGGLQTAGLDLVVQKTRQLVEDPTADVAVEVVLPAETEQRLEVAEQLCEDAERELEAAIRDLRAVGMSVADIGFVFMSRRLRPEPRPLMITNIEIAEHGLSRHPEAVGVRWSDHGFAETTKCRPCVERTRDEYVGLPEDGTNELLYTRPVECDFFDIDHVESMATDDG